MRSAGSTRGTVADFAGTEIIYNCYPTLFLSAILTSGYCKEKEQIKCRPPPQPCNQDTGEPESRLNRTRTISILLLDTRQSQETPEGANLPLTPAGVGIRILAQLIDLMIRTGIIIVVYSVLGILGGMGMGIALIIAFCLEWFYPVVFEVARQGRTPGKKTMGIRVVNDDGTPIGFGASLLRNLLRVVDFLPLFYLTGIIASLCNNQFKRLGDLAAGTLVIYDAPKLQEPSFDSRGQQPVPADFSTNEQRALLAFAERSKNLSSERQSELAAILIPVLGAKDPVITIKQMANSMVGKQ